MNGSIGFLLHPHEETNIAEALDVARAAGRETWTAVEDAAAVVTEHAAGCSLLVTVGGDGTFLLGARLAGPLQIPVLGVNRGRLGFLTDTEIAHLPRAIEAFLRGEHVIQTRSMLMTHVEGRGDAQPTGVALNDVVAKSPGVSAVRLRICVDDELLGDFDADGIVVATATGSTAYALSAGGPPVDPRVAATVIVPLAVHAVMSRAVIVPDSVTVRIQSLRGGMVAAIDGQQSGELHEGETLVVGAGPKLQQVHLASAGGFAKRLRHKLRLGIPLKSERHGLSAEAEADGPA